MKIERRISGNTKVFKAHQRSAPWREEKKPSSISSAQNRG